MGVLPPAPPPRVLLEEGTTRCHNILDQQRSPKDARRCFCVFFECFQCPITVFVTGCCLQVLCMAFRDHVMAYYSREKHY